MKRSILLVSLFLLSLLALTSSASAASWNEIQEVNVEIHHPSWIQIQQVEVNLKPAAWYQIQVVEVELRQAQWVLIQTVEVELRQAQWVLIQTVDVNLVLPSSPLVWTGAGDDNLASNPDNWNYGVRPYNGADVVFDSTSVKDCTWDLGAWLVTVNSLTLATGYTGTLTQGDVDIGIGDGWFIQQDGVFVANDAQRIICAGDVIHTGGDFRGNLANLIMSGDGATLSLKYDHPLRKLTVTGDIVVLSGRARELVNTGTISVANKADFEVIINSMYTPVGYYIDNQGTIYGAGTLWIAAYDVDPTIEIGTASHVRLSSTMDATGSRTFYLATPIDCQRLMISSEHATYTTTLDLDAQTMTVNTLTIGARGAMLGGEGVIRTAAWDSSAGSWTPEDSTVVLSDGGSAVLAPGQAFNELYIDSADGRTASWTMTATGTQAPIVTGLESGVSYRWYLDGVEQGEVEADENGTIALSYESVGLHELSVEPLSVGPGPDAPAPMDGLAATIGIVAVLTVLGGLITMIGRPKF